MGRQRRRQSRDKRSSGSSCCRFIQALFGLACLGAGGYITWHFLGRPNASEAFQAVKDKFGDFTDVLEEWTDEMDFGDYYDEDPFVSDNTTYTWETNGKGGLYLTLWNALDDTWEEEYEAAVYDWENGDPDALSLTSKRVEVDHECKPVSGLMKVCNGNYQASGWLGINLMSIVGKNTIVDSVAKMNEYYLFNADEFKRRYTMCHEIGHGFGLAHTDENFNNADMGNCLDYTHNPKNNLYPGQINFDRLAAMYGVIGERRNLRSEDKLREATGSYSDEYMEKYNMAVSELEELLKNPEIDENNRWRLLHEHDHGGVYVRRLDENVVMKARVLYAD